MRWLLAPVVVALLVQGAAADDKQSNPALLGIGMSDLNVVPGTPHVGGVCRISTIMRGSGARAAGLQGGDVVQQIEGTEVVDCMAVQQAVLSRQPGDVVTVVVARRGQRVSVQAALLSRAEILRRRLVGASVMSTELYPVDDERPAELSTRGRTTVVGWFDPRCVRCDDVFRKVADWARKQSDKPGAAPLPLAVASAVDARATARTPIYKSLANTFDVPVALADPIVFEEFTIPDAERIQFTVIDCRGVVRYVAPVAPTGDDAAAALDEVFAAAEQAARQAIKR